MRSGDEAEEELRSVGVGTSVGHGEDTGTVVLVDEVLIGELSSVDGLTTGTVSDGEVITLLELILHRLSRGGSDKPCIGSLVAQ